MEKKRIIRNIILVVITALIVSLTATFAFWKKEVNQEDSNFVKSLCMDVSLINEEDDILLESAYPISDEEGLSLKPYKFTIKNNCETTAKYNINFELLNSTTLSDEYVAISLNGIKNGILNELDKTSTTIENALSNESGYSLEEGTLNGGEEKSYELRLWMDKSVTAEDIDSMNKTLEGKITLIADYIPQIEINNTLTEWGLNDTIKIHGYSRYHKIVAYSISEEKDTFNWKNIEEKKEINIEEEIDHNGKYYVSIKDEADGVTTKEITINKVDNVLPEILEKNITSEWLQSKELSVKAIDRESGIVGYQITKSFEPEKDWNEIEATNEIQTFTKEISENGEWYVHIKDKVGNIKTESINVDNIDTEGPTISIENNYNDIWTKDNVNVILNINETGSGIDYCEESTDDSEYTKIEQEITDNKVTLTYTGNHNETRYYRCYDKVGNVSNKENTTLKIDQTLPTIEKVEKDENNYTNGKVKVTITAHDDVGLDANPYTFDGEVWQEENEKEYQKNDENIIIKVKDHVGNIATYEGEIKVDNIDTEGPTISIENNYDNIWTNNDVSVVLNLSDNLSGIDYCEESTDDSEYTRIDKEIIENTITLKYNEDKNEVRYFKCYDKVGNESNKEFTTLKIDKTNPTIESVTKSIDTMTNQSVTVTINASDDVDLDSKPYSFDGGISWIAENQKEYQYNDTNINIQVKDHVGNITTYDKEIKVDNIDKQGPTISKVEKIPEDRWTNESVTIKVTASDDVKLAKEAYSFDDGLHYQESNEMTYENNKSGIKIKVKDDVGNETSYTEEINITNIDHTEPSITNVSKSESNWTSGSVTLTIEGVEDLGGSGLHDKDRYSFDGGSSWQLGNTKEYLANESNIVIKVQDNAGNIYTYPTVQSITNIDTDGPDIKSMNVSSEWEQTNEISTTVIDKDSGIAGYEYSTNETINEGNLTKQDNLTEEQTYKKSVDVNTKWYIHVKDQVGNVSSRNITVEKVDKDAPTIEVVNDKTSWTNEDVTVKINVSNISSGSAFDYCEESTNDSDYTKMTETLSNNTISKTYTGNHNETRYYRCYDKAKNRSLTKSTTLKIDQELPSMTGVKKSSSAWTNGKVSLTIEGAGDTGGSSLHSTSAYSFNNGVDWQASPTKEYSANESNITIKVRDNAGNIYEYPTKQEIANIEKEPPSITGVKKSSSAWTNGKVSLTIEGAKDTGGSGLHSTAAYSFNNGTDWQSSATKEYSANESNITIKVRDNAGNIYTYPTKQEITNIEKEPPSITGVKKSSSAWTNGKVSLTIEGAKDTGGSGLHDTAAYSFNNGTDWQASATKEYSANESNIVIKVRDNAGNIYEYPTKQEITNIEKEPPSITGVKKSTSAWTNGKVSLTIEGAKDTGGSGLHSTAAYSFNNGTDWQASATKEYSANESNITIKVRDNAGNIYTYPTKQEITNIEKEPPSITGVSKSNSSWTKDNVTLTINGATDSGGSGLHSTAAYSFNNGTDWQASNKKEYQANENNIIIKVRDNAGNIYTYPTAQSITNIDKEPPSVPTVNLNGYTSGKETYDDVKITLTSTDNQSVSYYEYSTNKSSTTRVPNNPWTISDELNATYYFRAVDHVGNPSGWTGAYTINKKVTFASKVVKCGQAGTNAATCIKNNANLDTTNLKTDDTRETNLRYVGANETVNNYIDIGDRDGEGKPVLWRIIGVMNNITNLDNGGQQESLVKIIRAESVGNYSWDSSAPTINSGYGVNEWSQADIMKLLNPNTVYSGTPTIGGSLYWNRGSGSCYNDYEEGNATCNFTSSGISEEAKNKIVKVRWNTGTFATYDDSNLTAKATFEAERSSHNGKEECTSNGGGRFCNDEVPRTTTWEGYIGLMYPSDFGYAVGGDVRETCLGKSMYFYNTNSCKTNDWLITSSYTWTMTPSPLSLFANGVFNVPSSGCVNNYDADDAYGVQPVVYLSSSVKIIDGNGEKGTPYKTQLAS